jgi:hypothetical protein
MQIRHFNAFADETMQISIWSNVEASLGIAAGSLMTVRPLLRFLADLVSSSNRQSFAIPYPILSSWSSGEELRSRWEY